MNNLLEFLKEHFTLIFITLSVSGLIKFLVSSYIETRKMRVMNKDSFKVMVSPMGINTIDVQTSDLKIQDLINGLNSHKKIEDDERKAS